jgi:hypothetical protein
MVPTGTLKLSNGDEASVETNWESLNLLLRDYLRLRFPITDSPADGPRGARQLMEAAEVLGGEITWAAAERVLGRVY